MKKYWLLLVVGLHFQGYAQTCVSDIVETTPITNFLDNGNGTVTDLTTGLMWMQCSLGQTWSNGACVGDADTLTWQQALQQAHGSHRCGRFLQL